MNCTSKIFLCIYIQIYNIVYRNIYYIRRTRDILIYRHCIEADNCIHLHFTHTKYISYTYHILCRVRAPSDGYEMFGPNAFHWTNFITRINTVSVFVLRTLRVWCLAIRALRLDFLIMHFLNYVYTVPSFVLYSISFVFVFLTTTIIIACTTTRCECKRCLTSSISDDRGQVAEFMYEYRKY